MPVELLKQRSELIKKLKSDEHYAKTETLAYGDHNPFVIPQPACDACGSLPVYCKTADGRRHIAFCSGCSKKIQHHQEFPYEAKLMWCERNLGSLNYQDLPLFGLKNLDPEAARKRMSGIRENLELRKKLAAIELEIARETGERQPSRLYQERLNAYLKWAMLALRLIKVANVESAK